MGQTFWLPLLRFGRQERYKMMKIIKETSMKEGLHTPSHQVAGMHIPLAWGPNTCMCEREFRNLFNLQIVIKTVCIRRKNKSQKQLNSRNSHIYTRY